ncbi:Nuclear hormone receptor family member nhr-97 [Toxocara canis]|uniref:Nuclear hormone receptor family member nhr-97 n=1 Tax=Toxocara canis TaxID=6265 RepID=A0A0B2US59_TOXCA|nr:Nuclear hormone receptor family member nhr-97 [Toxocara canis]
MASDAQPSSKQRNGRSHCPDPGIPCRPESRKRRLEQSISIPAQCVVCGDRACSHHYYGVAACHGCKCFFWRSVKANAKYVCRYGGNCAIDINGRNCCRYCRFSRCIQAGMKPEAVRMEKQTTGELTQSKQKVKPLMRVSEMQTNVDGSGYCPGGLDYNDIVDIVCSFPNHSFSAALAVRMEKQTTGELTQSKQKVKPLMRVSEMQTNVDGSGYCPGGLDYNDIVDIVANKKQRFENCALMNSLIQTERIVAEGVTNIRKIQTAASLREAFADPSKLDVDRTPIRYGQKELPNQNGIETCGRRMLVAAIDWIRLIANFYELLTLDDKVSLLRSCYAPLTVFELCAHTAKATLDRSLLCLPNGFSISCNEMHSSVGFLSSKMISSMIDVLVKPLWALGIDDIELSMLKAIIILNPDAIGLSSAAAQMVSAFRDRVHAALYQHCIEESMNATATIRFARLFHLLPKITTLAVQLEEHIQLSHTFCEGDAMDPLLCELLGDIFEGNRLLLQKRPRSSDSTHISTIAQHKPIRSIKFYL